MDEHRDCCGGAANALDGRAAATNVPAHRVVDPVCGMQVDPATSRHRFEHAGQVFHFCSPAAARSSLPIPPPICAKHADAPPAAHGNHPHLPDAPGGPPGRPRHLPALRHGAGAAGGDGGGSAEPRADRHDAPAVDRRRAGRAGGGAGDGRAPALAVGAGAAAPVGLGAARASPRRWCCGPGCRSSSAAGPRW